MDLTKTRNDIRWHPWLKAQKDQKYFKACVKGFHSTKKTKGEPFELEWKLFAFILTRNIEKQKLCFHKVPTETKTLIVLRSFSSWFIIRQNEVLSLKFAFRCFGFIFAEKRAQIYFAISLNMIFYQPFCALEKRHTIHHFRRADGL